MQYLLINSDSSSQVLFNPVTHALLVVAMLFYSSLPFLGRILRRYFFLLCGFTYSCVQPSCLSQARIAFARSRLENPPSAPPPPKLHLPSLITMSFRTNASARIFFPKARGTRKSYYKPKSATSRATSPRVPSSGSDSVSDPDSHSHSDSDSDYDKDKDNMRDADAKSRKTRRRKLASSSGRAEAPVAQLHLPSLTQVSQLHVAFLTHVAITSAGGPIKTKNKNAESSNATTATATAALPQAAAYVENASGSAESSSNSSSNNSNHSSYGSSSSSSNSSACASAGAYDQLWTQTSAWQPQQASASAAKSVESGESVESEPAPETEQQRLRRELLEAEDKEGYLSLGVDVKKAAVNIEATVELARERLYNVALAECEASEKKRDAELAYARCQTELKAAKHSKHAAHARKAAALKQIAEERSAANSELVAARNALLKAEADLKSVEAKLEAALPDLRRMSRVFTKYRSNCHALAMCSHFPFSRYLLFCIDIID